MNQILNFSYWSMEDILFLNKYFFGESVLVQEIPTEHDPFRRKINDDIPIRMSPARVCKFNRLAACNVKVS